ncbi:MAG: hypothetical protein LW700_14685 [Gemmataceae bacterium]|nr:hypothetical protein [Gemmataceae bacterium]
MRQNGWVASLVALVAGMAFWLPARAEEVEQAPATGRTLVLVAGAGTFKDPAIKPRPGAEKDAKALYDLLADGKHLKLAPGDAKLLVGAEQATRAAFLDGLRHCDRGSVRPGWAPDGWW